MQRKCCPCYRRSSFSVRCTLDLSSLKSSRPEIGCWRDWLGCCWLCRVVLRWCLLCRRFPDLLGHVLGLGWMLLEGRGILSFRLRRELSWILLEGRLVRVRG